MNRGPPEGVVVAGTSSTAALLRAVRQAPSLVDDVGVLPRLLTAAAEEDRGAGSVVLVRWTRAWLVVWQAELHGSGVIGAVAPWTVTIDLARIPTLKGDPDGGRRAAALALLEQAGLLERLDRAGGDTAVRLAEPLFVPSRAGLEVDWGHVCRTAQYEPASLLVLRAVADLITALDEPAPVSLRALAGRTGYAEKQVRVAVRRLVRSGLLDGAESPGQAARYRFSDAALGRGRPPLAVGPQAAGAPAGALVAAGLVPPAGGPSPAAPDPGSGASAARSALRLTLNGVTLTLGGGLTAHVAYDADGIPHLTVAPRPVDG